MRESSSSSPTREFVQCVFINPLTGSLAASKICSYDQARVLARIGFPEIIVRGRICQVGFFAIVRDFSGLVTKTKLYHGIFHTKTYFFQ